jgi:hypothetical protein
LYAQGGLEAGPRVTPADQLEGVRLPTCLKGVFSMSDFLRRIPVFTFRQKPVDPTKLRTAAAQGKGTEFFQQFGFGFLVNNRQPLFAYNEILRVLQDCKAADEAAYKEIHKGGPFYWLGMAAFMFRDFETSVYFMDAAVSEDLRRNPLAVDTPAMLFISLRGDHPHQAAREFVKISENAIGTIIATYLKYMGRDPALPDLTIDGLRNEFLLPATQPSNPRLRSTATALLSFFLETGQRKVQLDNVPNRGSSEPFILHLFKGGLLVESLVKLNPKNPPSEKTLGKALNHVAGNLGIPAGMSISANELQDVIDQADSAAWTIEKAFQISGRIRNTTGHSLGWQTRFTFDQYGAMVQNLCVACLHTINALYVH